MESILDPTVGSGGMLIRSKKHVQEIGGDPRNLELAGQELNGGTCAMCKMNMLLHGIRSADKRKNVLFINADREFKEGKNQNSLRAEDIEKIAQVYRFL